MMSLKQSRLQTKLHLGQHSTSQLVGPSRSESGLACLYLSRQQTGRDTQTVVHHCTPRKWDGDI